MAKAEPKLLDFQALLTIISLLFQAASLGRLAQVVRARH